MLNLAHHESRAGKRGRGSTRHETTKTSAVEHALKLADAYNTTLERYYRSFVQPTIAYFPLNVSHYPRRIDATTFLFIRREDSRRTSAAASFVFTFEDEVSRWPGDRSLDEREALARCSRLKTVLLKRSDPSPIPETIPQLFIAAARDSRRIRTRYSRVIAFLMETDFQAVRTFSRPAAVKPIRRQLSKFRFLGQP